MEKFIIYQSFPSIGVHPRYVGTDPATTEGLAFFENPSFATTFTTEQDAVTFMREEANLGEYGAVTLLSQALVGWEKRIAGGFFVSPFRRVLKSARQAFTVTGDKIKDQVSILEWWLCVYEANKSNIPQQAYSERSGMMFKLFKFFAVSGFWSDTLQTVLTIKLTPVPKEEQLQELQQELLLALPFVKPYKGEWGDKTLDTKRFAVLEPSLSRYEVWRIEYAEENKTWRLKSNRHEAAKSTSLEDFLKKTCKIFRRGEQGEEE